MSGFSIFDRPYADEIITNYRLESDSVDDDDPEKNIEAFRNSFLNYEAAKESLIKCNKRTNLSREEIASCVDIEKDSQIVQNAKKAYSDLEEAHLDATVTCLTALHNSFSSFIRQSRKTQRKLIARLLAVMCIYKEKENVDWKNLKRSFIDQWREEQHSQVYRYYTFTTLQGKFARGQLKGDIEDHIKIHERKYTALSLGPYPQPPPAPKKDKPKVGDPAPEPKTPQELLPKPLFNINQKNDAAIRRAGDFMEGIVMYIFQSPAAWQLVREINGGHSLTSSSSSSSSSSAAPCDDDENIFAGLPACDRAIVPLGADKVTWSHPTVAAISKEAVAFAYTIERDKKGNVEEAMTRHIETGSSSKATTSLTTSSSSRPVRVKSTAAAAVSSTSGATGGTGTPRKYRSNKRTTLKKAVVTSGDGAKSVVDIEGADHSDDEGVITTLNDADYASLTADVERCAKTREIVKFPSDNRLRSRIIGEQLEFKFVGTQLDYASVVMSKTKLKSTAFVMWGYLFFFDDQDNVPDCQFAFQLTETVWVAADEHFDAKTKRLDKANFIICANPLFHAVQMGTAEQNGCNLELDNIGMVVCMADLTPGIQLRIGLFGRSPVHPRQFSIDLYEVQKTKNLLKFIKSVLERCIANIVEDKDDEHKDYFKTYSTYMSSLYKEVKTCASLQEIKDLPLRFTESEEDQTIDESFSEYCVELRDSVVSFLFDALDCSYVKPLYLRGTFSSEIKLPWSILLFTSVAEKFVHNDNSVLQLVNDLLVPRLTSMCINSQYFIPTEASVSKSPYGSDYEYMMPIPKTGRGSISDSTSSNTSRSRGSSRGASGNKNTGSGKVKDSQGEEVDEEEEEEEEEEVVETSAVSAMLAAGVSPGVAAKKVAAFSARNVKPYHSTARQTRSSAGSDTVAEATEAEGTTVADGADVDQNIMPPPAKRGRK